VAEVVMTRLADEGVKPGVVERKSWYFTLWVELPVQRRSISRLEATEAFSAVGAAGAVGDVPEEL
jgi:hypothetical protein